MGIVFVGIFSDLAVVDPETMGHFTANMMIPAQALTLSLDFNISGVATDDPPLHLIQQIFDPDHLAVITDPAHAFKIGSFHNRLSFASVEQPVEIDE